MDKDKKIVKLISSNEQGGFLEIKGEADILDIFELKDKSHVVILKFKDPVWRSKG